VPSGRSGSARMELPTTTAWLAASSMTRWLCWPAIASWPRWRMGHWATRLPIEPDGTNRPASLPRSSAARSSSAMTVGRRRRRRRRPRPRPWPGASRVSAWSPCRSAGRRAGWRGSIEGCSWACEDSASSPIGSQVVGPGRTGSRVYVAPHGAAPDPAEGTSRTSSTRRIPSRRRLAKADTGSAFDSRASRTGGHASSPP